ncbi:glutathione S-transferase-like protein [Rickenella mellea]|uniref:glutathione transferase n=1 Tax=Rickenella mellea TaxID=50990 RepID=A0A4Y7PQB7_9AGAM|nr:glutathione S-transferase-like protein [Rickenella mellea]
MTLKLFGAKTSTCTRRVAVVCKELNIPYELIPIDLPSGQHKSEEYRQKQPFGQVPVIDDNGFILFESRAICRYLVRKYGKDSDLIPADLEKEALFEQASSIEQHNFDPYAYGIATEKVFKLRRGLKGNDELAANLQETLVGKMKGYEAILENQKYLAGDTVTLADLFHLPYGTLITDGLHLDVLTATPHVSRWWKDISSRASWQAVKDGA